MQKKDMKHSSPPDHRVSRAKSRGHKNGNLATNIIECEIPKCSRSACAIHHIWCSYRGERDNSANNLIAVCYHHHELIHSRNTFDLREKLLDLVKTIIDATF